jgi:DNA-binding XRE family transcriptional regulator
MTGLATHRAGISSLDVAEKWPVILNMKHPDGQSRADFARCQPGSSVFGTTGYSEVVEGSWGSKIRAARFERAKIVPSAFTVVAVAHRVGVNERTVRSWETGRSRPHQRHARRLAKELGVTLAVIGLDERQGAGEAVG